MSTLYINRGSCHYASEKLISVFSIGIHLQCCLYMVRHNCQIPVASTGITL